MCSVPVRKEYHGVPNVLFHVVWLHSLLSGGFIPDRCDFNECSGILIEPEKILNIHFVTTIVEVDCLHTDFLNRRCIVVCTNITTNREINLLVCAWLCSLVCVYVSVSACVCMCPVRRFVKQIPDCEWNMQAQEQQQLGISYYANSRNVCFHNMRVCLCACVCMWCCPPPLPGVFVDILVSYLVFSSRLFSHIDRTHTHTHTYI